MSTLSTQQTKMCHRRAPPVISSYLRLPAHSSVRADHKLQESLLRASIPQPVLRCSRSSHNSLETIHLGMHRNNTRMVATTWCKISQWLGTFTGTNLQLHLCVWLHPYRVLRSGLPEYGVRRTGGVYALWNLSCTVFGTDSMQDAWGGWKGSSDLGALDFTVVICTEAQSF